MRLFVGFLAILLLVDFFVSGQRNEVFLAKPIDESMPIDEPTPTIDEKPTRPAPLPECATIDWPKRNGELLWAEVRVSTVYGTTDPQANALQVCKEAGYSSVKSYQEDFTCEHTGGSDNDESSYSNWNGNSWSYFPTPSSNRCYVMFKSVTCCNDCETYNWPKRDGRLIWGEYRYSTVYGVADPDVNALQFCNEEGFASVGSTVGDVNCQHTGGDDNDESGYSSYDENLGDWKYYGTPSANRCYVMYKKITCCNECETFNWPKRRGELIWAEDRYSTIYGFADASLNAEQFCREEGYLEVGHTVADTDCEHTGGSDNDESGYSSYDPVKEDWEYFGTPSSNRCYAMYKSITCCGECTVFEWPKRNGELIWGEYRYSTVYGTADPHINAEQFCAEEGYGLVGYTVGDVDCLHTGGSDNDESGYASWNGSNWIYFGTPSKNRCYVMFKSITCCPEEIYNGIAREDK